jgi:hypothetical protein
MRPWKSLPVLEKANQPAMLAPQARMAPRYIKGMKQTDDTTEGPRGVLQKIEFFG